jgi:glycosyltransferase involved in cell wall biosynthesis
MKRAKAFFFDSSLWALHHFRGAVIRSLIDAGWEIIILCPREEIDPMLKIPGCRYLELDVGRTTTSILSLISTIISFYSHVQRERPDFVFSYTIKPIWISGIVSWISNYHAIMIFAGLGQLLNQSKFKSMLVKTLTGLSLAFAKKIILSNKDDFQYFLRSFFFKKSSFVVLPYGEGLDTNYFSPEVFPIGHVRKITFLMIGRLLIEKGVLQFIESARRIKKDYPDSSFILCGYLDFDHPKAISKEVIEDACADGLIDFVGTVPDTRSHLNDSKCFIMPSFYNEGMNRSIMDALSMGVPVITTDNRGCRDLVQDEKTGFIVQPKSIDDLCYRMRSMLLMSESDWSVMSVQARNFAINNLDVAAVVNVYRGVVNEISPSSW